MPMWRGLTVGRRRVDACAPRPRPDFSSAPPDPHAGRQTDGLPGLWPRRPKAHPPQRPKAGIALRWPGSAPTAAVKTQYQECGRVHSAAAATTDETPTKRSEERRVGKEERGSE